MVAGIEQLINASPLNVYLRHRESGVVTAASALFCRATCLSRDELIGGTLYDAPLPWHECARWVRSYYQFDSGDIDPTRSGKQHDTMLYWAECGFGLRKQLVSWQLVRDDYIYTCITDMTNVDQTAQYLSRLSEGAQLAIELGEKCVINQSEWYVLWSLLRNVSYKEIARILQIEVSTVKYYIRQLRGKLGANSVTQLIQKVYANGLVHMMALDINRISSNWEQQIVLPRYATANLLDQTVGRIALDSVVGGPQL